MNPLPRETQDRQDARCGELLEASGNLLMEVTPEGVIAFVSDNCSDILGYARTELLGRSVFDFVHPDEQLRARATLDRRLRDPAVQDSLVRFRHRSGDWRWLESRGRSAAFGTEGRRVAVVSRDVTERVTNEHDLRAAAARYTALFNSSDVGIAILEHDGSIREANPTYRTFTGGAPLIDVAGQGLSALRAQRESMSQDRRTRGSDGQERWLRFVLSPLVEEKQRNSVLALVHDVTALHEARMQCEHDTRYDRLTGLGNRVLFEAAVSARIASGTEGNPLYAVALLDIDRFKHFNESTDHARADLVLCEIAKRLQDCVSSDDTVCRYGGDKYALLINNIESLAEIETLALRLRAVIAAPVAMGVCNPMVTACIGIAVGCTGVDTSCAELTRDADIALSHAKGLGPGRHVVFQEALHEKARSRLALATSLHEAVTNDEIFAEFQPIVSLLDGMLYGCEALARWQHPTRGRIMPDDFIKIAENERIVTLIGPIIFRQACRAQTEARRKGLFYRIHVNLSVCELFEFNVAEKLARIAAECGADPTDITLEITEYSALNESGGTVDALTQLRAAGFSICVDDFGIGHSTLRYLTHFPIDSLKVDREFVSNAQRASLASDEIVRSVLTLARSFHMGVIAEGVETAMQKEQLWDLGCKYAQGYLFSQPITADEVVRNFHPLLEQPER